jgi:hypothetical protein
VEYEPLLERFAIAESDYLVALQEVTRLFPHERSLEYFRAAGARLGSFSHFDLLPYPNEQLPYNPVPILLNVPPNTDSLSQLLDLGLALRDIKKAIGPTKAFKRLIPDEHYSGALFEIEVGAELVRSGLKPTYRTTSPDYVIEELPLGVEATKRDVPIARVMAERLIATLAFLEFKYLSIELTVSGEQHGAQVADKIMKDVEQLLSADATELFRPCCRIQHDLIASKERTVAIILGDYRYEETLSHLITCRLEEKEGKIRKGLAGRSQMNCVAALDLRSLLALPIEPESGDEGQLAERHQRFFDRLRAFRQEVIGSCQAFTAQSPLIKGACSGKGREQRPLRTRCTLDTRHLW